MQGRITKVLNMKPPEILGMIEEAAGTRMFENKKQAALKTIDKKESKVQEITNVLAEEITPTLERLRAEQSHYVQFQANATKVERLERFCVAHEYAQAEAAAQQSVQEVTEMEASVKEMEEKETELETSLKEFETSISDLQEKKVRLSKRDNAYPGAPSSYIISTCLPSLFFLFINSDIIHTPL